MNAPERLLAAPVERAARWLALGFLRDAEAAAARLGRDGEDDALHDFRVAMRRLRSTARGYRGPLRGAVRKRDRRALKEVAAATGEGRDLEVATAWLRDLRDELAPDEAPGVDLLLARAVARARRAAKRMDAALARPWPRLRRRLADRLSWYRVEVAAEEPVAGPAAGAVLATLVADAMAELAEALGEVRSVADQAEAHRARIAGKRLRYLLEPVAAALPGGAEVGAGLKRLQDTLGRMHDAHVLLAETAHARAAVAEDARPDPRPGLRAVADVLAGERERTFARFREEWMEGGAAALEAAVEELRRTLAGYARADVEVERRFLLKRLPRFPAGAVAHELEQGWIPGARLLERVRRVRVGGTERYYRTVKVGSGVARLEMEEETTRDVFVRLWALTRGRRVRKTRWVVRDGEHTWEIDRFRGRRLVLAEVELDRPDAPVRFPPWLARVVVREVTEEPEYVNYNLAT
jgi:CHAD domain-containing protein/CYTH domain-containing protein